MQNQDLCAWLQRAMPILASHADELAQLDAAAGDGDLGFTVTQGAAALGSAAGSVDAYADQASTLRILGAAFARGNPSSFAALTGIGLVAAARVCDTRSSWDRAAAVAVGYAAASAISERGGAVRGERTVLDALIPSIEALEQSEGRNDVTILLQGMIDAAHAGAEATRTMVPRRGRAAWTGDRASGQPDAGATAYVRFLQALLAAWPA